MDIVKALQDDQRVTLGGLSFDEGFIYFVSCLPRLLGGVKGELVSASALMQAQYEAVVLLARLRTLSPATKRSIEKIANGLSEYENAELFLRTLPTPQTAEEFLQQAPGLTQDEVMAWRQGRLTIGDLLEHNPAVILRPILQALPAQRRN